MAIKIKRLLPAGVALVFSAVMLSGCGRQAASEAAATPPEVGVIDIQAQALTLTTELSGRTSAYLVSEVRPQVGGIIQKRQFVEGAEVKAGQPLYQIDPASYQATYDSARASLAKAEASLVSTRNKASRYEELVAIKAVSQQDNDDSQAALKQAQADVAAAKAAVETARINLDYTRVASPISGRIGRSSVTPGALVTASQASALSTVQQLDPIYVDVTQSSAELLRLKRDLASGQLKPAGANQAAVKLLLEDGSAYPLPGKLQFSDVTVDQNTGTIMLRAVFPNPKGDLLPGMYVRAVLEEGDEAQAILAPQQGVTRDTKGNPTALVVGADNKVELRVLKTRRVVGDKWLVSEGLKAGDKLIVDGLQKIAPGMAVHPVSADKAVPAAPAAAAQH
ncbi:efflux RND transporter periplasmic adaptor subunit [Dechloromonas denitrificans]|uniref:efflux RND transporter periplasmic adaptor subunit n=1 Tax=Dechloromonas denitrificans TaxID=281362 RepID=UPI001CFB457C|nr:efflux RND transporter periplasmic adaptor subunit [Dechloromonas denitrificans]UCV08369.1 efflux RND transporter periplasmic adaptor subunit [Dechloromonas denitrificans]